MSGFPSAFSSSKAPSRFTQSPAASPRPNPTASTSSYRAPLSSLNPHVRARAGPVFLGADLAPVLPLTPVSSPRYQGLHTTYPSRMRCGTSSLMQPNALSASGTGGMGGSNGSGPATGGKRQRNQLNYADIAGIEEDDDPLGEEAKRSKSNQVWGDGRSYLGVLPPGNLVQVQPAKPTKHGAFTEDQMEDQAKARAVFVPVQIDIDVDTFKIRDAFVWNVNEKLITPEAFARVFCDDLDIPQSWAAEVAKQISEQCEEHTGIAEIAIRGDDDERDHVEKDLRVILNLDVQIGTLHLVDRIEWDLSSSLTPELFATILVRDLALSSSASPLIAHALHAELYRHKKNCLEMGLVIDDAHQNEHRRERGAKQLAGVWREWTDAPAFGPRLEVLTLDEMDKVEADRERAIRRAKRDRLQNANRTGGNRRR